MASAIYKANVERIAGIVEDAYGYARINVCGRQKVDDPGDWVRWRSVAMDRKIAA